MIYSAVTQVEIERLLRQYPQADGLFSTDLIALNAMKLAVPFDRAILTECNFKIKTEGTGISYERKRKASAGEPCGCSARYDGCGSIESVAGCAKDLQSGRQRSHAENDRSDASLFSFKLTIDFPMWRGYNSANNEIPMKPLRKRSTLTKPGVRELPAV